jgi:hypothetical protein
MGDGSLQSHPGANLHPKTMKDRGNVPKGGKPMGLPSHLPLYDQLNLDPKVDQVPSPRCPRHPPLGHRCKGQVEPKSPSGEHPQVWQASFWWQVRPLWG